MIGVLCLFILFILLLIVDGTFAAPSVMLLILISGLVSCTRIKDNVARKESYSLFLTISPIYIFVAFIISLNFENGGHFLVLDPTTYTPYLKLFRPNIDYTEYISRCYLEFSDSNALHEVYVAGSCIIANKYLGGATVLFETLIHTIFGILSSLCLFRILVRYFHADKAKTYTICFALLSPFLFYSSVIIRDIIIAYFYLRGFEIILGKFSYKKVLVLTIYLLVIFRKYWDVLYNESGQILL